MNARRIGVVAAVFALLCGGTSSLLAQDNDEAPAITARVHATFVDNTGGAGVLSGDMSIVRFEVRNGTVTAIGRIAGALADSAGNVLGQVDDELALPVGNIDSTCNQLQINWTLPMRRCSARACTSRAKWRDSTRVRAQRPRRCGCCAR